jgi:predicted nuclease with TOPRIM domain
MNYDNLTDEELLKEVYLNQHKDRLLTLVCERLEIAIRERDEALAYGRDVDDQVDELAKQIDRLNYELGNRDDEVYALESRVSDLEKELDSLTDDSEF